MKVIVHDLDPEEFLKAFPDLKNREDVRIIAETEGSIRKCIGCFGCWIKTPMQCIIKDGYDDIATRFAGEEIIIISRCVYGGYSRFVKNVFDRSIGSGTPFFEIRNGELKHVLRENKDKIYPNFSVYMYGNNITDLEKEMMSGLYIANKANMGAETTGELHFINDVYEEVPL
jgi:multimeric flavodoxin WrbA